MHSIPCIAFQLPCQVENQCNCNFFQDKTLVCLFILVCIFCFIYNLEKTDVIIVLLNSVSSGKTSFECYFHLQTEKYCLSEGVLVHNLIHFAFALLSINEETSNKKNQWGLRILIFNADAIISFQRLLQPNIPTLWYEPQKATYSWNAWNYLSVWTISSSVPKAMADIKSNKIIQRPYKRKHVK